MRSLYFLTVNYNSSELISRLIKSIQNSDSEKYTILIVNNSPEDTGLKRLNGKYLKIIEAKQNLGFGSACNLGLSWIYDRDPLAIVWSINPDAYFKFGCSDRTRSITKEAIAFFANYPQISILGTTIYNASGEITDAGGTFTPKTAALSIIDSFPTNFQQDYLETDWVSGCSLLINLANFKQCPLFDPRYFLYYEDLDFCLRYRQQGHKIAVTQRLNVIHDTSSITDRNIFQKYKHITYSYLIHVEKYGSLSVFVLTNIRMLSNTIRLILFKPDLGRGKLVGFYNYWRNRLANNEVRSKK